MGFIQDNQSIYTEQEITIGQTNIMGRCTAPGSVTTTGNIMGFQEWLLVSAPTIKTK